MIEYIRIVTESFSGAALPRERQQFGRMLSAPGGGCLSDSTASYKGDHLAFIHEAQVPNDGNGCYEVSHSWDGKQQIEGLDNADIVAQFNALGDLEEYACPKKLVVEGAAWPSNNGNYIYNKYDEEKPGSPGIMCHVMYEKDDGSDRKIFYCGAGSWRISSKLDSWSMYIYGDDLKCPSDAFQNMRTGTKEVNTDRRSIQIYDPDLKRICTPDTCIRFTPGVWTGDGYVDFEAMSSPVGDGLCLHVHSGVWRLDDCNGDSKDFKLVGNKFCAKLELSSCLVARW